MKKEDRKQPEGKQPFLKDLGISFALDTKSGVPFYRQIIQMVEYNVGAGKLSPGDRLPTIRALSITLKINPNTIAKAYMELELRGFVKTQVGSGTYICENSADTEDEQTRIKKKIEELCLDLVRKAGALGVGKDALIKLIKNSEPEEEGK
jgi:GntR family transcriptional regulator